jgi:hypothetical protein
MGDQCRNRMVCVKHPCPLPYDAKPEPTNTTGLVRQGAPFRRIKLGTRHRVTGYGCLVRSRLVRVGRQRECRFGNPSAIVSRPVGRHHDSSPRQTGCEDEYPKQSIPEFLNASNRTRTVLDRTVTPKFGELSGR